VRELLLRFVEAMNARDWDALRALLAPDLVFEVPQRGERLDGRDAYIAFNAEDDSGWQIDPEVLVADDHAGAVLFRWNDDWGIAFLAFSDGVITTIRDFFATPTA
jgi:ketosteroid isomerase-like protein